MPELSITRTITEKQRTLLKEMAKKWDMSIDKYLWLCICAGISGDIDEVYDCRHPQRKEMLAAWAPKYD